MAPMFVQVTLEKEPLHFALAIQKLYSLKASQIFHFVWEFASV